MIKKLLYQDSVVRDALAGILYVYFAYDGVVIFNVMLHPRFVHLLHHCTF